MAERLNELSRWNINLCISTKKVVTCEDFHLHQRAEVEISPLTILEKIKGGCRRPFFKLMRGIQVVAARVRNLQLFCCHHQKQDNFPLLTLTSKAYRLKQLHLR